MHDNNMLQLYNILLYSRSLECHLGIIKCVIRKQWYVLYYNNIIYYNARCMPDAFIRADRILVAFRFRCHNIGIGSTLIHPCNNHITFVAAVLVVTHCRYSGSITRPDRCHSSATASAATVCSRANQLIISYIIFLAPVDVRNNSDYNL